MKTKLLLVFTSILFLTACKESNSKDGVNTSIFSTKSTASQNNYLLQSNN